LLDALQAWSDLQPRLAEAAKEERDTRSEAWLDVPLSICGVSIRPLTLRRYSILTAAGNAFVCGTAPSAADIGQFLWVLSDRFTFDTHDRDRFLKSIASVTVGAALVEIYAHLEAVFFDAPTGGKSDGKPYNGAIEASIIHRLAKEYGWGAQQVLDLPMAQIFQLFRAQERDHGKTLASPLQDKLKAQYMEMVNN
jgi:hypothetical protein